MCTYYLLSTRSFGRGNSAASSPPPPPRRMGVASLARAGKSQVPSVGLFDENVHLCNLPFHVLLSLYLYLTPSLSLSLALSLPTCLSLFYGYINMAINVQAAPFVNTTLHKQKKTPVPLVPVSYCFDARRSSEMTPTDFFSFSCCCCPS